MGVGNHLPSDDPSARLPSTIQNESTGPGRHPGYRADDELGLLLLVIRLRLAAKILLMYIGL